MFFIIKPDPIKIQKVLNKSVRGGDKPTYTEGLDLDPPPSGFVVDHHRTLLGKNCFETARRQLRSWKMYETSWTALCWEDAPIAVKTTFGTLIWVGFAWSLCPSRIVNVIDEPTRHGFSHATLPGHEACGEERFLVEVLPNGEVWFDIYAISKPQSFLAKLGRPVMRFLQKRFAVAAGHAMLAGVRQFHR